MALYLIPVCKTFRVWSPRVLTKNHGIKCEPTKALSNSCGHAKPLSFSAPLSTHTSHSTPSPLLSLSSPLRLRKPLLHHLPPPLPRNDRSAALILGLSSRRISCKATEVSVVEEPSAAGDGENWVPVVPLSALPKGERRVIIQDGETILLWLYTKFMWRMKGSFEAHASHVRISCGLMYIIMLYSFKYQIKNYGLINNKTTRS